MQEVDAHNNGVAPPDVVPDVVEEIGLDRARQAISAARQKAVAECVQELNALLRKHNCSLSSYQEFVNGMPKGPAQVIVVANE